MKGVVDNAQRAVKRHEEDDHDVMEELSENSYFVTNHEMV